MILGVIAAILIIVAGARLVTSAGNTSAKESAKKLMTNLIIGYLIVLAAWLVLDYGLRALLLQDGTYDFGVWNQISCVDQPVASYNAVSQETVVYLPIEQSLSGLAGWVPVGGGVAGGTGGGGSDSGQAGGGTPGTYTSPCTPITAGPSGQTAYSCVTQQSQCTAAGGTPTLNATRSAVICTPRQVIGGGGGGGGSCTVVTNPSNACHPNRLTCFPDRNLASEICNVESNGGNTQILSGTDRCLDGRSFSVGLWQINILANRNLIPGCSGTFFTSSNGGQSEGTCAVYRTNSRGLRYCQFRSCRITNVAIYNRCVASAQVPANNTNAACSLMRTQGWGAWITSYNRCR